MLLLLGVYTASITIEILPLFRSIAKSQVSDRCQLQGCWERVFVDITVFSSL